MRPVHCDRPSALHAVVCTAGLSILVAATVVPFDVTVTVVVTIAIAVVVVSSASVRPKETCWARAWRPLMVVATLLTRAHLPPRGDIFSPIALRLSPQSHTDM